MSVFAERDLQRIDTKITKEPDTGTPADGSACAAVRLFYGFQITMPGAETVLATSLAFSYRYRDVRKIRFYTDPQIASPGLLPFCGSVIIVIVIPVIIIVIVIMVNRPGYRARPR